MERAMHRRVVPHSRNGFTVLELLVTIAVAALLMAIILPAVHSARESARSHSCRNNLRQIGLALHNRHEQHGCLPPGWRSSPDGTTAFSWAVPLLPYLEQRAVLDSIDYRARIVDSANAFARRQSLSVFLCPSDVADPRFTLYPEVHAEGDGAAVPRSAAPLVELPTANYVGVFGTSEPDDIVPPPPGEGAFYSPHAARFRDFRRGLSNTIFVGERTMARVPSTWLAIDFRGEDAGCRILGQANLGPNRTDADECEFDSRHAGTTHFLWGDGRVQAIGDSVDRDVYRRSALRDEY